MLRSSIFAILVIILIFICVSCNDGTSNDNATIQVWSYDFINTEAYSKALADTLSNIKFFCEKNEIPMEIMRYSEKDISYDDYVLKRNAAVSNGNAIIIEDASYIHDLAKHHADYTKLENYNNLLDVYKDKFCIPLGIGYSVLYRYNDAINFYGINTDNPLITYNEYLEIKQQMKEKGARFKLNYLEFKELIDYFSIKNNIKFINEESEILKQSSDFKESLKNTIIELCDDFKLYNNKILSDNLKYNENTIISYNKNDYTIYDENSLLILCDNLESSFITYRGSYVDNSILDKTFVIDPDVFISPSFFMYKKITNDKIYDLANYIVSESSYFYVAGLGPYYSPVFNGEKTRKMFYLNDDWQYEGEFKAKAEKGGDVDKRTYDLFSEIYEVIARNEDKSNLLTSYYYTNREYSETIYNLIADIIIELSNKNYEYSEEINKMIDNKIDEFVTNFNIHYK